MLWLIVNILLILHRLCDCYIVDPGPLIIATKGAVWPKPYSQHTLENFLVIRPNLFQFRAMGNYSDDCENFLQDAFKRYWKLIRVNLQSVDDHRPNRNKKYWFNNLNFHGYLDELNVELITCDERYPKLGESENYTLSINSNGGSYLKADNQWGVLHGLETFSQLIYNDNDTLFINLTNIYDKPRFPHRGLLLDTSRHFIPVEIILQILDAMSYNKLNVFHWHIVDDQSFPYKSTTFPQLSDKGAYHPVVQVYQQTDIKMVIEYARLRGIRVIPEFDTPGHTRSWGVAFPELLTKCFDDNSKLSGKLGPMDPTNNQTYDFLKRLFNEIVTTFPDDYFHIGGDEVGFECWQSNNNINEFMQNNNITTYEQLESYFIQNIVDILDNLNAKYLVWEEVFVNGVQLPNNTIVQVWRENGLRTLQEVIEANKFALYSSCFYLDHLDTGGDWLKYYQCEPLDFHIDNEEQKKLILGGEACMWTEVVNQYNVMSRIWPRASAVAERLWSTDNTTDVGDAKRRLEEHTCRMNRRGIGAQPPNGAGFCL